MRALSLLLPALVMALAAPLGGKAASEWLEPDAAYSAVRVMRAGGMEMRGPVHHDGGRERWEVESKGMRQVMIRRLDQERLLMFMPDMNVGMEMDLGQAQQMPSAESYATKEPEKLGRETLAGEETTKYRLVEETDSGPLTILFWVTDDGIPLRMEGSGAQGDFEMVLSDLKRGAQDPELFKTPAGLQIMPVNPAMTGPIGGTQQ